MIIDSAVVLTGGLGTRLRAESGELPKALVRVGGACLIDYSISLLAFHGIRELHLCLGYGAESILKHVTSRWPGLVVIPHFDQVDNPGSAGALLPLRQRLSSCFVLMASDILTDLNLSALAAAHRMRQPLLTLPVQRTAYPYESHMVEVNDGYVVRLLGKPTPGTTFTNLTFHPICVMSPAALEHIPSFPPCDIVHDLIPRLLGEHYQVAAHEVSELILDCGTPERLARARALRTKGWLVEIVKPTKTETR